MQMFKWEVEVENHRSSHIKEHKAHRNVVIYQNMTYGRRTVEPQ